MLLLELQRFSGGEEATLGLLFDVTAERKFLCFILEDQFQTKKVYGETRIPAGRYGIKLRVSGGKHPRYAKKYGDMHKGMLWLQDVPGFEWVYIHTGNNDDHTDGCLLTGDTCEQNITEEGRVGASVSAYKRIYPEIANRIADGANVYITIKDEEIQ